MSGTSRRCLSDTPPTRDRIGGGRPIVPRSTAPKASATVLLGGGGPRPSQRATGVTIAKTTTPSLQNVQKLIQAEIVYYERTGLAIIVAAAEIPVNPVTLCASVTRPH